MQEKSEAINSAENENVNVEEVMKMLQDEPEHNHNVGQGITLDVNTVIELMQNRTDYERLINVILMNTRLSYDGKLISKENSNILDYLSLINPNIEQFIKEKTQELKNEEEK